MKRSAKSIIQLISLILAALMLSSCAGCSFLGQIGIEPAKNENSSSAPTEDHSSPTDDTEKPSEEVIVQYNDAIGRDIMADYCREIMKSFKFLPDVQFLAQFGNSYAVYVFDKTIRGNIGAHFIDGYEFRHKKNNPPYLYKEGKFYILKEAIELGYIDAEDLKTIHEAFKELNADDYKLIYSYDERFEIDFNVINITIQPTHNRKEYTVEDFAEIGCTDIKESEYYGEPEAFDLYRHIRLYFSGESVEDVLAAIKILEERDDIYSASPNTYIPIDW
jgi:hypothetical protein